MVVGGGAYVPLLYYLTYSPETTNVGYAPTQPVPFSHAMHVGRLQMDCRYCHTSVEDAAFAAIPPTQTCMNCHSQLHQSSDKLALVRESYSTGKPIDWVKVHDLADYVYFNHAIHVAKGVGCVTCHGRIDKMGGGDPDTQDRLYQAEPLSMSWCLDCHRNPEQFIRPREEVFNLAWTPPTAEGETPEQAQLRIGRELLEKYNIHSQAFMTSCSTCHR